MKKREKAIYGGMKKMNKGGIATAENSGANLMTTQVEKREYKSSEKERVCAEMTIGFRVKASGSEVSKAK